MVPQGQQAEDPRLLRIEAQLPQRTALEDDLGLVGQVGVRLAGPQPEQPLEDVDVVRDRPRGSATRGRGRW